MTEKDQPRTWPETALNVGANLLPKIAGSIKIIYDDCRSRHEGRLAETVNAIAEETGLDALRGRLDDPEIEALFLEGLDIATRTGVDAKRRLLASVIAQAVTDDAKIEEAQLITMALRDLDAPHVRAMVRIRAVEESTLANTTPPPPRIGSRTVDDYVHEAVLEAGKREPTPVIAALIRTGVAHQATLIGGGTGIIQLSEFGLRLLDDLASDDA